MDPELPASPLLVRLFAESPWTLAFPLLVAGAALAWWGARNERVRPILGGIGLLVAAAAVLAVAAFRVSPGEHAAERVRALVAAAEAADLAAFRDSLSDDATMHHGGPQSPGDGIGWLMRSAEALRGRHRIESNAVTELSWATVGDDRGAVLLGCRTATRSSPLPVTTRWWIEVHREDDGRWLIDRIAWLRLMGEAPPRGII